MNDSGSAKSWIRTPGLWWIFLLYLALAALSFNRGMCLPEEGYHLYPAWLWSRGRLPYRDFQMLIFPLPYLIKALLIKAFGFQLIILRAYTLLLGVAGFFCIASISRKVVPGRYWLVGPGLYIFYSNNLFNIAHYSIDSRTFLLINVALFLAWAKSRRLSWVFLAGFFAGMAGLSYQTFNLFPLLELAAIFWMTRKLSIARAPAIIFLAGYAIVPAAWVIYLHQAGLVQESIQNLFQAGAMKTWNFQVVLRLIYPVVLAVALGTVILKKIAGHSRTGKIFAALILLLLIVLEAVLLRNYSLLPHMLALILPPALFALVGMELVKNRAGQIPVVAFVLALGFFLIGPISGYDLGHSVAFATLLLPFIGYLISTGHPAGGKRLAGIILLASLFAAGLAMFLTRPQYNGEMEPLYRDGSRLELETAKWIYTSEENKQDLERIVAEVQKRTGPEEKILVYPDDLLIYPLAGREAPTKRAYFFFELGDEKELETAVNMALAQKMLVIFRLKDGKLFQPMASAKSEALIAELSRSCVETIRLHNFLICPLKP